MSAAREGKGTPVIALVVAMGENRAIGRGGDLPWHIRSDMRYFREITMGKPIIMGRLTFASLPRVLDGRLNIVLTRDAAFQAPGAVIAHDHEEAL
ncbi:MAG TPA: dihydrofolate reductase, partial [Methyloceanibacter sp.]|nr:dihydrofolate reductase [Methyloceanibacter sp.]